MKKFTSFLAVFVIFAMVGGAYAQSGSSGAAGSGSSSSGAPGAPAGATSGSTTDSSTSGGSGATTGNPATGTDKSRAEHPKPSSSPSASPSTMASGDFTGRHTMEGEVVSIDQKKGHLKLKTAEGNMDLHFPPSTLANVKKGDRIAVELAMKPAGSASLKSDKDTKGSASPKMDKEKK